MLSKPFCFTAVGALESSEGLKGSQSIHVNTNLSAVSCRMKNEAQNYCDLSISTCLPRIQVSSKVDPLNTKHTFLLTFQYSPQIKTGPKYDSYVHASMFSIHLVQSLDPGGLSMTFSNTDVHLCISVFSSDRVFVVTFVLPQEPLNCL